jgi:hypothetical protein
MGLVESRPVTRVLVFAVKIAGTDTAAPLKPVMVISLGSVFVVSSPAVPGQPVNTRTHISDVRKTPFVFHIKTPSCGKIEALSALEWESL